MRWLKVDACNPVARAIADGHYSRQNPGSPRFMPPGRCLVLLSDDGRAVFGTSWPYAEYVKHQWPGAWVCSIFRNQSDYLSSGLILEAVAATRWYRHHDPMWSREPEPAMGMVTFVDPSKVPPKLAWRRKDGEKKAKLVEVWGGCYLEAGFKRVENTKGGLLTFQLLPADMPPPVALESVQLAMAI